MSRHQLKHPNLKAQPFEVGQKVWINMTHGRRDPSLTEAIITKVGRKWVDLDQHHLGRFDCGTMQLDGGRYGSPGKVYLSPEVFNQEVLTQRLWSELSRRIPSGSPPEGMTIDKIRQVAALLGIPLPE